MRNFTIYILLFVVFTFGCKPKNQFTINGVIKGSNNGTMITLSKIVNNAPFPLDSCLIAKDGTFKLKSLCVPSEVFVVSIGSRKPHIQLIANPNDQIEIEANANALLETYQVKGSKESELVADLSHHFLYVQHKIDSLQRHYDQIIQSDTTRVIREKRSAEILNVGNTFRIFRKAFIDKNMQYMACLYALQGLNPDTDFQYYAKVDSLLLRNYIKSDQVQQFHRFFQKISEKRKAQSQNEKMTEPGMSAPEISLPTPAGQVFNLSTLRGKIVLVDFWASWNGASRVENKLYKDLYQKYKSKGFEILQISIDTKRKDWVDAIKKDSLPWINVSDLKANTPALIVYNVQAIPFSILIDRDGKILYKNIKVDLLEEKLDEIL